MRGFFKNKKIFPGLLLILTVSFLGVFVVNVKPTNAGFIEWFGFDSIGEMIFGLLGWIAYGIFFLVSRLLWLGGMLLDGVLGIQKFTNVETVSLGWGIVRDLTNMFFVLILLVISFATILRFETYGAKAILPKLIAAALLINFSLVFCGAIIDSSQVVTQFFLNQIKGQGTVSASLMEGLQIQKAVEVPKESVVAPSAIESPTGAAQFKAGITGSLSILIGLVMGIIIIILATIAIFAASLFLIVRMLYLWFLIILAPIVWLFWILPATREHWNKWWNNFLKWVFFAPVYVFFLYLAIYTIRSDALKTAFQNQINVTLKEGFIEGFWGTPMIFFQYLIIIAFLYGGLIVAQKTGVYGAQGAIGLAKGAGKGAAGLTGALGLRAVQRLAPPPQKTLEGKEKGGLVQRGLRQFAKAPLAGKLAAPALGGLEKIRAAVDKEKEKTKGWTSDNLAATFDRANAEGKTSRMLQLYENDDLDKLNPKQQEQGLKLAQRYGKTSNLIKALPGFTEKLNIGKKLQDIVNSLSPDKMTKLVPDQVKTEGVSGEPLVMAQEVQKAIINAMQKGFITSAHLGKIGSENQPLARVVQKEIMGKKEVVDGFPTTLKDYLKSAPGKSIYSVAEEWLGQQKAESVISSPSESEFQKAKQEGYKGK